MIGFIIKKIIGSKNDREVKRLRPLVARINEIESELQTLPDDALRQKTAAWKAQLSKIQDNDELARRLDEILPEAFAVVKNACRRLVRHARSVVRGASAEVGDGPLRRAAHRRLRAALRAGSRKWPPAKARRWWRRCRSI